MMTYSEKPFPRRFVAADFIPSDWAGLEPYYRTLSEAPLDTAAQLERWLREWSELRAVADEFVTRRYIEMTCHTDDPARKEAYLYCVREVEPKLTEWDDTLNRRYYESPARAALDPAVHARLDRMIAVSIELFDARNIPVQVTLQERSQRYQEIMGAMTVHFEGQERTMPQMAKFLREPDRALRERAWRAAADRRLKETDTLDALFDEMLALRAEYAHNLGLADYREYCFKSKLRDYTADDCLRFHTAIEKTAVPLARALTEERRRAMGLDGGVAPWDADCDEKGRPPLAPFEKVERLTSGVAAIFNSVDPRFGERYAALGGLMDLDSRKGKAPGGYQATLAEAGMPFIFTNAVGSQNDVNTLLHEGGHAFHTLQCRQLPLIWYRHAPMEFSEVASMTQELLGGERLEHFYATPEERARARREHLAGIVTLFPWVAQVDAFQHWLYTHPGHTREQRGGAWMELSRRFSTGVDWTQAPEEARRFGWQRQLHIFEVPFYYIEYAIAQLGALQIYRDYRRQPKDAVDRYLAALALGGSKSAPELFAAAGARFDFSEGLMAELMDLLAREIETLS